MPDMLIAAASGVHPHSLDQSYNEPLASDPNYPQSSPRVHKGAVSRGGINVAVNDHLSRRIQRRIRYRYLAQKRTVISLRLRRWYTKA
jgi:hypothetical protein